MQGLETTLLEINRFGPPMLYRGDSGWRCSVDLSVSIAGVTFTVESDAHPTPYEAADTCFRRIHESLSKLGVNAGNLHALPA